MTRTYLKIASHRGRAIRVGDDNWCGIAPVDVELAKEALPALSH